MRVIIKLSVWIFIGMATGILNPFIDSIKAEGRAYRLKHGIPLQMYATEEDRKAEKAKEEARAKLNKAKAEAKAKSTETASVN